MELQQALERHSRLPVWCLSRANQRLVQAALAGDWVGQHLVAVWEDREYVSDLTGLFELLNVRYMQESAQLPAHPAGGARPPSLDQMLRCWLRANPRQATVGNLLDCLRLLRRPDILERLDTRLFVEYYHVYLGYHRSDSGKAAELTGRLARHEPGWRLLDSQLSAAAGMQPADVRQRCFSSVLLVSQAYLAECSDYWRVLIQEKYHNYPTFCITVEASAQQQLPRGMRLFPTLAWAMLRHTPGFFEQLRRSIAHQETAVCQSRVLQTLESPAASGN